jgi:hypothetical protein
VDLDAFRQMVAKNPKGFLGRYGLGNKLIQEGGSLEEAVEHLTAATQLDPTHVASHLHLGRASYKPASMPHAPVDPVEGETWFLRWKRCYGRWDNRSECDRARSPT